MKLKLLPNGKCLSLLLVIAALTLVVSAQGPLKDMQLATGKWGGAAVSVDVNPRDANHLLVMSGYGGLWKSADGGYRWQHLDGFPGIIGSSVKFCPSDPRIILATSQPDSKTGRHIGVWRSTDFGVTWSSVGAGSCPPTDRCPVQCGAAEISWVPGSQTVYVATDCGLIRSRNNGQDWELVPVDPSGMGSFDLANQWRLSPDRLFSVLAIDERHVLCGGESGQYFMHDGATWHRCEDNVVSMGAQHALSYVPQNHSFVFRADYSTNYLMYSTDMGITWARFPKPGFEANNMPPFTKVTAPRSGLVGDQFELYFGTGYTVYKMTLGLDPAKWEDAPITELVLPDHPDPTDLCFHPTTGRPMILAGDWGVARTTNDGINWTAVGNGEGGYNALEVRGMAVQKVERGGPSGSLLSFITWHNHNWFSWDGGQTLTKGDIGEGSHMAFSGPVNASIGEVRMSVMAMNDDPILVGAGWSGIPLDPAVFGPPSAPYPRKISFFKNPVDGKQYTLAIVHTSVLESVIYIQPHDGTAWREILRTTSASIASYPQFATVGNRVHMYFLESGRKVAKIEDVNGTPRLVMLSNTGFGWVDDIGTQPHRWVFAVKPDDDRHLLASESLDECIMKSTDGGMTWFRLNTLTSMLLGGTSLYYHFTDGKAQARVIAYNPYNPNMVIIGTYENGAFISYDNANTWQPILGSGQLHLIQDIRFGPNGTVYFATLGRGIWTWDSNPVIRLPGKLRLQCPSCITDPATGARVPIEIVGDPENCPACHFVLAREGRILDYSLDAAQNLLTVTATHPFSVFYQSGPKSGLRVKVVPAADPKTIDPKAGKSAIEGLFLNGGQVVAVLADPGDMFTVTLEQLAQALGSRPETSTPYVAPTLPKPKHALEDVPLSKAVLTLPSSPKGMVRSGDKVKLQGTGFFPKPTQGKPLVHFFANGILLPEQVLPDAKGNFEASFRIPLPPGEVTLVALYENGADMAKAELRLRLTDWDEAK